MYSVYAWLWYKAMYWGDRLLDFGRGVGRLMRHICGHLWESWMSRHNKRNGLKREEEMINRVVSKALDDLYRKNALSLHRMNYWIARFADAGIHDVGYDPDPRLDARAYGKPWWKPAVSNTKAVKSRIINHLLSAQKIMGNEYTGLSVTEIKTKLKTQKLVNSKQKERKPKTKFKIVEKTA